MAHVQSTIKMYTELDAECDQQSTIGLAFSSPAVWLFPVSRIQSPRREYANMGDDRLRGLGMAEGIKFTHYS